MTRRPHRWPEGGYLFDTELPWWWAWVYLLLIILAAGLILFAFSGGRW